MATRQYTIISPAGPIQVNETSTRLYSLPGIQINETIPATVVETPTVAFHAKVLLESTSSGNPISSSLAINPGESILVVGAWQVTGSTPNIVTTGGVGSDTLPMIVGPTTDAHATEKYGVWLLQSAEPGRTGLTLTYPSTVPTFCCFYCYSFSGLYKPILDQQAIAAIDVNAGPTPTLTSTNEFAVEFAVSDGSISAIGAPWTSDGNSPLNNWGGGHQIITSSTAGLTSNFTGESDAMVFTFKSSPFLVGTAINIFMYPGASNIGEWSNNDVLLRTLDLPQYIPYQRSRNNIFGSSSSSTVVLDAKATADTATTGTIVTTLSNANLTVGAGAQRALLAVVSWMPGAGPPTSPVAHWDTAGTNQLMTQIGSIITNVSHASVGLFGLLNPTSGNKNFTVTWTNTCDCYIDLIAFTGVDQTSIAAAFPNFIGGTGTASPASVAIASASGHYTVATFAADATADLVATNQTNLYGPDISDPNGSGAANYAVGSALNTHTCTLTGSGFWAACGCDVAGASVVGGAPILLFSQSRGYSKLFTNIIGLLVNFSKAFVAGGGGSTTQKALTILIGQSISLFKQVGKILTVPISEVVKIFKSVGKILTVPISEVVKIFKQVGKSFSNPIGQIVSLFKGVNKKFNTSIGQVISLFKQITKTFTVPIGLVVSTFKNIGKVAFVVQIGQTVSTFAQTAKNKLVTINIGQVVSLFKSVSKTFTIFIGETVSTLKNITKTFTNFIGLNVLFSRLFATNKTPINISIGQQVSLFKQAGKIFNIPIGQIISTFRQVRKIINVNIGQIISTFKNIGKTAFVVQIGETVSTFTSKALNVIKNINIGQAVSLFKQSGKIITNQIGQLVKLFKQPGKILTIPIGLTVSTFKQVGKLFTTQIGLLVNFARNQGALGRTFIINIGQNVTLFKQVGKIINIPISQLVSVFKRTNKIFTTQMGIVVSFIRQFAVNKPAININIGQTLSIFRKLTFSRIFTVSIGQAISIFKQVGKIITTQISNLFSAAKASPKKVSTSISQAISIFKTSVAQRSFTFIISQQTKIFKQVGKILTVVMAPAISLYKRTNKIFRIAISSVVNFTAQFFTPPTGHTFTINIGSKVSVSTIRLIFSKIFARPFNTVKAPFVAAAVSVESIKAKPKQIVSKIAISVKTMVENIKVKFIGKG